MILDMVTCGDASIVFDERIPSIISTVVGIIKIGVPILLIIFGMLDLGKVVLTKKDEEIKRHQGMFIKRVIAAALVFFVFAFTELFVSFVAPNDEDNIVSCMKCFIKDNCIKMIEVEAIEKEESTFQ